MSILVSAITLMLASQALDPKLEVAGLYAAFGMQVGPEALTLISPASLDPNRVYSGPEVNGKRTRSAYFYSASNGVGMAQVANKGSKPDIPGEQALPWANLSEAVALANATLALLEIGHETQVRIIDRADRLDNDLMGAMGVGLRASYDFKLDGYPFIDPKVGIDFHFDRNGVLRSVDKAIRFPERSVPGGSLIGVGEAQAAANPHLTSGHPIKHVLGWVSEKGQPAKLVYRFVQQQGQGPVQTLYAQAVDVDAVSGSARKANAKTGWGEATQALLP